MKKIRELAQIVGFVTLGLLALYGLLALSGAAGLLGLAVAADARAPAEAAILGSEIPATMNYQGFVRDLNGDPITGEYEITARIYELAAETPGETVFYATTVPNVTVRDGLFNIVLGDAPPLPVGAFSDTPRYIGIDLDDGEDELVPRQRLHAVPWALTASTLVDDAQVQGLASSGDITLTPGSDVIVEGGDIDATGNLVVTGDINATGSLAVTGDINATGHLSVTQGLSVTGGLTVQPSPVVIKRFENIGNDANVDTLISSDEYECVATGWSTRYDILEAGIYNNMVWTWVDDTTKTWWATVTFASHNDDENADLDIVCFRKEITEWQGSYRQLNNPD